MEALQEQEQQQQQQQQQHLAIESFSYSWLINLKPSFDALDHETFGFPLDSYDDECFIEIDPKMAHLKSATDAPDFDFDFDFDFNFRFSTAQPRTIVHADQIFADGLLVPLHLISTSRVQQPTSDLFGPISEPTDSPVSSAGSSTMSLLPSSRLQPAFLRRCRRSSRRIFLRCLGFLRPLYSKVQQKRKYSEGMAGSQTTMSCTDESLQTNPRLSTASSTGVWGHSNTMFICDMERSISEAVLHCRRSIGESAL